MGWSRARSGPSPWTRCCTPSTESGGGKSEVGRWEFSADIQTWEQAAAPAQVGRRLFEGLFQRELPDSRAALVNNIMHLGVRDRERCRVRRRRRVRTQAPGLVRRDLRRRRVGNQLRRTPGSKAVSPDLAVQLQGPGQGPQRPPGLRPDHRRRLQSDNLREKAAPLTAVRRSERPCAARGCAGPPGSATGCQSPAHWPDFGPDAVLGWPALVGAGELPVQDSGPLMWLPATIVEPVLFCTTSGPATVAPSIVT